VEAHFKQYLADFASASPGGSLTSLTENPMRALVCLCGHPVMPGTLRTDGSLPRGGRKTLVAARDSFKESFAAALRYRHQVERHDSFAERVANLERILQTSTDSD
jgi:hypothetical protein